MVYHAIENTVASTIDATYARRMMGRLGVISSNIQRLSCILTYHIPYGIDASAMVIYSITTFDPFNRTNTNTWYILGDRKRRESGKDTTLTLTMLVTPC